MPQLSDRKINRLSHQYASGHTGCAREIARLLGEELRERRTEPDPLLKMLEQFLCAGVKAAN
jgi:hypothetical protein